MGVLLRAINQQTQLERPNLCRKMTQLFRIWIQHKSVRFMTGWWFGTLFIFPYIGNNHPNWLFDIVQRGRAQPPTRHGFVLQNVLQAKSILRYGLKILGLLFCEHQFNMTWWCHFFVKMVLWETNTIIENHHV